MYFCGLYCRVMCSTHKSSLKYALHFCVSSTSKEPSQQRVKRWAFGIDEVFKDPVGREQFLKFLESEFSSENLRYTIKYAKEHCTAWNSFLWGVTWPSSLNLYFWLHRYEEHSHAWVWSTPKIKCFSADYNWKYAVLQPQTLHSDVNKPFTSS